MELKIWVDGYQRLICGISPQTTCQEVIYALAHATGKTGRFVLVEKWRTSERSLSPHDKPLELLLKWGEYASDVQFVLKCLERSFPEKPLPRCASEINAKDQVSNFPFDMDQVHANTPQFLAAHDQCAAARSNFANISTGSTNRAIHASGQRLKSCSESQMTVGKINPSVEYAEIRRPNRPNMRPFELNKTFNDHGFHMNSSQNDSTSKYEYMNSANLSHGQPSSSAEDKKLSNDSAKISGASSCSSNGTAYNRKPVPPRLYDAKSVPKPPRNHLESLFPLPSGESEHQNSRTFSTQPVENRCQRSPGSVRAPPSLPAQCSSLSYESSTLPRLPRRSNNITKFGNVMPQSMSSNFSAMCDKPDGTEMPLVSSSSGFALISERKADNEKSMAKTQIRPSNSCQNNSNQSAEPIPFTNLVQSKLGPQRQHNSSKPSTRPPPPSYEEVMRRRKASNYSQIVSSGCTILPTAKTEVIDGVVVSEVGSGSDNDNHPRVRINAAKNTDSSPSNFSPCVENKISQELCKVKSENVNKCLQINSLTNKCQSLDEEIAARERELQKLNQMIEEQSDKKMATLDDDQDVVNLDRELETLNEILKDKRSKVDEIESKLIKEQNLMDLSAGQTTSKSALFDDKSNNTDSVSLVKSEVDLRTKHSLSNLSDMIRETTPGIWV